MKRKWPTRPDPSPFLTPAAPWDSLMAAERITFRSLPALKPGFLGLKHWGEETPSIMCWGRDT